MTEGTGPKVVVAAEARPRERVRILKSAVFSLSVTVVPRPSRSAGPSSNVSPPSERHMAASAPGRNERDTTVTSSATTKAE